MGCCRGIIFILLLLCSLTNAFFTPLSPRFGSTVLRCVKEEEEQVAKRVIDISEKAMGHLTHLISKNPDKQVLRMGVKAGGCSGMSYVMDLIPTEEITSDDHEELFDEGVRCVVDPKSVLFLYGLQLDYSDDLIGGGFKFSNPNADKSCGCGKSFGV